MATLLLLGRDLLYHISTHMSEGMDLIHYILSCKQIFISVLRLHPKRDALLRRLDLLRKNEYLTHPSRSSWGIGEGTERETSTRCERCGATPKRRNLRAHQQICKGLIQCTICWRYDSPSNYRYFGHCLYRCSSLLT